MRSTSGAGRQQTGASIAARQPGFVPHSQKAPCRQPSALTLILNVNDDDDENNNVDDGEHEARRDQQGGQGNRSREFSGLAVNVDAAPWQSCESAHRKNPLIYCALRLPSIPAPPPSSSLAHIFTMSSKESADAVPQIRTLDKQGKEITSVGFNRFGFDSEVQLDLLRSLYLRAHYVTSAPLQQVSDVDAQEDTHHARFTKGFAGYQSKSIFHPETNSISYTTLSRFPPVRLLPPSERKRILVTGGAGFVGSHLVDRLMLLGHEVTVIDNFFTGSKTTVSHWVGHPNFELVRHDVVEPFMIECDREYRIFR